LEEYAASDKRIKIVFRAENGHISAASNSALEMAAGEFTALLDHDDELSEDALFFVVKEINDFPATEMIYSDEDMIDESGRRYEPKFKPDWSRDLFYSLNLITHLSVYRTKTLRKISGFRIGMEGRITIWRCVLPSKFPKITSGTFRRFFITGVQSKVRLL
jgi:glycosyltransferase involved in cell wall biosynthesis